MATLQLSGDHSGDTFALSSDGKGGTEITVTDPSPALHRFVEAIAASSPSDAASLSAAVPADTGRFASMLAAHG